MPGFGAAMAEVIDRSNIERNARGCEEPHSSHPELWNFDGTEVDLAKGHTYVFGKQLWYLRDCAQARIQEGAKIPARPMNTAARASGIKGLPPLRPGESSDEAAASGSLDEVVAGLGGLDESPPREAVMGPSGQIYVATTTFYNLKVADQPRKAAIQLVEHRLFDPIILVTILANCVTMAWDSPLDPCCTAKAHFLEACEWVFLAVFTVEMVAKMIAYGVFGTSENEYAYLTNAWCQLDFVVVSVAWASIIVPAIGNYSVVRSIRALRPLRALKRMPGMPVLVNAILSAIPTLGNVLLLCGFLFLTLGIAGVELFKGELHYRCATADFVPTLGHVGSSSSSSRGSKSGGSAVSSIASDADGIDASAQDSFDSGIYCDPHIVPARCPADFPICSYFDANANFGVLSFDSFGWSTIGILQALTFDGWTNPMYYLMATTSEPYFPVLYFMTVVVLGGFFLVNLFLAVLFQEFSSAQAVEEAIARQAIRSAEIKEQRAVERLRMVMEAGGRRRPRKDPNVVAGKFGGLLRARMKARVAPSDGSGPSDSVAAPLLNPDAARSDASPSSNHSPGPIPPSPPPSPTPASPLRSSSSPAFSIVESEHEEDPGRCNCAPSLGTWRGSLGDAVNSTIASRISTLLVMLNLVLMAMPYYGMSTEFATRLEQGSTLITWLFIVEMALKLFGMGCNAYWADRWNQLDGLIVIMSIVELVVEAILTEGDTNVMILRLLRMLRVTRMLRLMRSWKGLYKILSTVMAAVPAMTNVVILMCLVDTIFALLGMSLFGGCFNEAVGYGEPPLLPLPRYNFDYFVPAMLTVFSVTTGCWYAPMLDAVHAAGASACIFFVVVVIVGSYVVMNLLVAALLQLFATDKDGDGSSDAFDFSSEDDSFTKAEPALEHIASPSSKSVAAGELQIITTPGRCEPTTEHSGTPDKFRGTRQSRANAQLQRAKEGSAVSRWLHGRRGSVAVNSTEEGVGYWKLDEAEEEEEAAQEMIVAKEEVLENAGVLGTSCGCLGSRSELRLWCHVVIEHPIFDTIIFFTVVASSLLLVADTPRLDPDSEYALTLVAINFFFTIIFTVESVLKSVACGFYSTPNAYLKSNWNVLDFLLLVISWGVVLSEAMPQLEFLKSLRALRVLRPLRLLSRSSGMRLVLESLYEALPAIVNVFGVVLALQLVFAILGMQLFMGTFRYCTDPTRVRMEDCVGVATGDPLQDVLAPPHPPMAFAPSSPSAMSNQRKLLFITATANTNASFAISPSIPWSKPSALPLDEGNAMEARKGRLLAAVAGKEEEEEHHHQARLRHKRLKGVRVDEPEPFVGKREWINPTFGSFDDFGSAMLLLHIQSSADDWDDAMFWAMDAPSEPGMPRERNDSSPAAILFVTWIFIGYFFAMQLFVGVVVDQFNAIRRAKDGSATMTEAQLQWVEMMKTIGTVKSNGKATKPTATGLVGFLDNACYRLARSKRFFDATGVLITINVIALCYDHWGFEEERWAELFGLLPDRPPSVMVFGFSWTPEEAYQIFMDTFTCFFYIEAAINLRALGSTYYFRDDWHRFEWTIVLISAFEQSKLAIHFSERVYPLSPLLLRVIPALRSLRCIRLVQYSKGLQRLGTTILASIPSLYNVISLLLLIIFIYAVLGVQHFTYLNRGMFLTDERNFDTFWHAALVCFQCLTSDGWSALMAETVADKEHAAEWLAITYFVSFQILCRFGVLNLVIAVILDNFTSLGKTNTDLIGKNDIELFSEAWGDLDPEAKQTIPITTLPDLIRALPQPMGLKGAPRSWCVRVCINLGLSAYDGQLRFSDVLRALVQYNYAMQASEDMAEVAFEEAFEEAEEGVHGDDMTFKKAEKEAEEEEEDEEEDKQKKRRRRVPSLLWDSKMTDSQKVVARILALEMLKISNGTDHLRRVSHLTHTPRLEAFRAHLKTVKARKDMRKAVSQAYISSKFKKSGRERKLSAMMVSDPSVLIEMRAEARRVAEAKKAKEDLKREVEKEVDALAAADEAAEEVEAQASASTLKVNMLAEAAETGAHALVEKVEVLATVEAAEARAAAEEADTRAVAEDTNARVAAEEVAARAAIEAEERATAEEAEARSMAEALAAAEAAVDMDEKQDASAKVQAAFRGKHARSEVNLIRQQSSSTPASKMLAAPHSPSSMAEFELTVKIEELSTAMRAAAAREDFVSAAAFRDALDPLRSRLARLSSVEKQDEKAKQPARAGTVTLTIDHKFDEFTPEIEQEVLRRLAEYGGVSPKQLVVLSRRAGSVILEVATMHSEYQHITSVSFLQSLEAVENSALAAALGIDVVSKKVELEPANPAESDARADAEKAAVRVAAEAQMRAATEEAEARAMAEALAAAEAAIEMEETQESASAKVQAAFRGKHARSKVKVIRQQSNETAEEKEAHAQKTRAAALALAAEAWTAAEEAEARAMAEVRAAGEEAEARAMADALAVVGAAGETNQETASAVMQAACRGKHARSEVLEIRNQRDGALPAAEAEEATAEAYARELSANLQHLLALEERAITYRPRSLAPPEMQPQSFAPSPSPAAASEAKPPAVVAGVPIIQSALPWQQVTTMTTTTTTTITAPSCRASGADRTDEGIRTPASLSERSAAKEVDAPSRAHSVTAATGQSPLPPLPSHLLSPSDAPTRGLDRDDFLERLHEAELRDVGEASNAPGQAEQRTMINTEVPEVLVLNGQPPRKARECELCGLGTLILDAQPRLAAPAGPSGSPLRWSPLRWRPPGFDAPPAPAASPERGNREHRVSTKESKRRSHSSGGGNAGAEQPRAPPSSPTKYSVKSPKSGSSKPRRRKTPTE